MAVKDLSNERRPQVTVPQDAESKFYIPEDLPLKGKHFDDPEDTVDTYSSTGPNLKKSVKDAKKLPALAENINIILANKFAGRDHYVQIDYVGCKLFYFLKWKNGMAAQKPIQLFEFNESNPPIVTKDFLAFEIGQKDITIEDNGNARKVVLKDGGNKSMMGPARYLTIPINAHKSYINYYNVVDVDIPNNLQILAGGKLIKQYELTQVKNGGSDKTTLYTLDIWPAGDTIKQKPSTDKIAIEKTPKTKDEPTPPQKFAERVIDRVTKDGVPENLDIFFLIDNSQSMQIAVLEVLNNIITIMKILEELGVKEFRAGIVTFNNPKSIHTLLPLTIMDKKGVIELFDKLSSVTNTGGTEPVGEAVFKSIDLLKNGNTGAEKHVFVLTDKDGLTDDLKSKPYLSDGIEKGKKFGIDIVLEKVSGKIKYYISFKTAAEVNKALFFEDKGKLIKLIKNTHDGYTRRIATEALAEIGGKDILLDLVKKTPNVYVYQIVAETLVKIGEIEAAKKVFLNLAKNAPNWNTRLIAAESLAKLGEAEGKKIIINIAMNDPAWSTRLIAANILVKIGEIEAAKEAFANIAKNAPKGNIRQIAAETLAELKESKTPKTKLL